MATEKTKSSNTAEGAKTKKQHVTFREGNALLKLDTTLNIASCGALCNELKTAMKKEIAAFSIDGSAVEVADTASLQLLLVLIKSLSEKMLITVTWRAVSESLRELAEVAGIEQQLSLEPVKT